MKFLLVASLLAGLVAAQSVSDLPPCSQQCIRNSIKNKTNCAETDVKCVCSNFDAIQGDAIGCVISSCGQDKAISMFF